MKYAHKRWMVAGLLAAAGVIASAQTPAPAPQPGPGPGGMMTPGMQGADQDRMAKRMERMQERRAKRLDAFKQKLQLSPGQEGAWNSFVAALKPSGNMQRRDRAEFARLPTPERIDRMRALRSQHIAEMDRRGDATKTFYAALTPEQRKVFDDLTVRRGGRGHGGWQHHRG
jgi:periplasmic protein CpxP/Spy